MKLQSAVEVPAHTSASADAALMAATYVHPAPVPLIQSTSAVPLWAAKAEAQLWAASVAVPLQAAGSGATPATAGVRVHPLGHVVDGLAAVPCV